MESKAVTSCSLPVMEHFYTLQGEGYNQGKACYFIRLAGCNVGCLWCDVKESWSAENFQKISIETIYETIAQTGAKYIVITGGEPSLYNLTEWTDFLHKKECTIFLETAGTNSIQGHFDWICLSPKKFKAPHTENFNKIHELKVIIAHPSDFKWAEKFLPMVSPQVKLYLQPEWSKASKLQPLIIDYIKSNPHWTLSLQIHKYLQIP
ncbi:MAG: 7-carboxy-7-deazaguanine synthase QueE [Alphaproteobacteria bacterium]|nr:7-carboxy-7-deazaguanine synthase QueE [Alphaproteobacteria bacterium]